MFMSGFESILTGLLFLVVALLALCWWRMRRALAQAQWAGRERAVALAARAEVEAAAQEAHRRLDALGQASLDALLVLDDQRRIVWGNQGAWELFGADGPAVGRPFIGLAHDVELNQAVVDAIEGRRPIVRQAASNGRTLRIRAVPVEALRGAAVAIEDVTELQRLGRARRDLVANISHELRTPLANIDLAAQTLRNGASGEACHSADPALAQRLLDQILAQVQTLSQLSQEMIDLAQIESGQALLKLVPGDLTGLVQRVVWSLLPQATLKNQHLSLFVPNGLQALMDEQQVGRAVSNLVHNAIKFTPEGGIISVYAEAVNAEDVRVCVADTGPGIPEAEQSRIFERFYKQDRARSKGGTGLGLAIARHIVEGHGGRIWVESTPGQGARFCFTLPRA
jgi:two-component system phosphate regulon sensor histidine kinase PhoR